MINWIFTGMIVLSVLFSLLNGRMEALSQSIITQTNKGIELVISLSGMLCLWSGLMRVADKAGLTQKISRFLNPITSKIFKGISSDSEAGKAISMNITANLLGLGNAATPFGIQAMKEMEKTNPNSKSAHNNMILFVVINTAAIQLIPTTTAMLRMSAGSQNPTEILPAVWISSICSLLGGILIAKFLGKVIK